MTDKQLKAELARLSRRFRRRIVGMVKAAVKTKPQHRRVKVREHWRKVPSTSKR